MKRSHVRQVGVDPDKLTDSERSAHERRVLVSGRRLQAIAHVSKQVGVDPKSIGDSEGLS
jgi:hypothetical protein